MSYKNYIKSQVKHHRCVICAKTFGAHYDKTINTFPVYHTSSVNKNVINCENVFFNEILRIYWFLHDIGESMSMRKVIEDFRWNLLRHCGHKPWIERQARDRFHAILREEIS